MKYLYFIFFVNILMATNNTSVNIDISVTASPVSDVSVNNSTITKTLDDIFDLRSTSNNDENVADIEITYQTNIANQKLTLSSEENTTSDFYLHHDNHTNSNKIRLLLSITKKTGGTKITPNATLVSTSAAASVLDSTLTINITLKTDTANSANAGDYTSTLAIAWMSI